MYELEREKDEYISKEGEREVETEGESNEEKDR